MNEHSRDDAKRAEAEALPVASDEVAKVAVEEREPERPEPPGGCCGSRPGDCCGAGRAPA